VGNTVRRVLHHIREEYHTAVGRENQDPNSDFSISKFVILGQPRNRPAMHKTETKTNLREDDPEDPDSFARGLKPVLMEAIQDVLDELETVYDNVSKNARDHVHPEWVPKRLQGILVC
jgi:translation initiation factor eIF-2B subunit beta